ncbi:MAG: hypothetical protein H3Z51_05590 [archaeon]|nr:hypothetical protein [archaeon]
MPKEVDDFKRYVYRRFGGKNQLISFLKNNIGVSLPESLPYQSLWEQIVKTIGVPKFLQIISLKSIEEMEVRATLSDALYHGLLSHELPRIYTELTGEQLKIRHKSDKKMLAHKLGTTIDEARFTEAWVKLVKEELLPDMLHYSNLTIGALGWIKSLHERKKDIASGYMSSIIVIILDKFDQDSANKVLDVVLDLVEQVVDSPNKFNLSANWGSIATKCLDSIEKEVDEMVNFLKVVQTMHIFFSDEDLINLINELIADKVIRPPDIKGLYEEYPRYSFPPWIVTKFGLIKQNPWWVKNPNTHLADIIRDKFAGRERFLEKELEGYKGDFYSRLLAKCIVDPYTLLKRAFGFPDLRALAVDLGMRGAQDANDDELIKTILLCLGFSLPPVVFGLYGFKQFIDKCNRQLEKEIRIPQQLVMDIYRETEGLLRDIVYLNLRLVWRNEPIDDVIRNKLGLANFKPFDKLGLGHFINIIRTLDAKVRKESQIRKLFVDIFGKDFLISKEVSNILDKISPMITEPRHKTEKELNKEDYSLILQQLRQLVEKIETEKIFSPLITIQREITNEYGTKYFDAIDDAGERWIIPIGTYVEPGKCYYLISKSQGVPMEDAIVIKRY